MNITTFSEVWHNYSIPSGWTRTSFTPSALENADVFFQQNIYNPEGLNPASKTKALKAILDTKKPYLVIETPVFRQGLQVTRGQGAPIFRVGWYHFLRSGLFNNKNCPGDRWAKFQILQGLTIDSWKEPKKDGHILIILQKEQDSSLITLRQRWGSQNNYLKDVLNSIRQQTDRKIVIRPHFLYRNRTHIPEIFLDDSISISTNYKTDSAANGGEGLAEDFKNAYCVVGYNSNALIESIMKGIPTISIDKDSHSYEVSSRITNINNPYFPIERTQWLYDLSYCQWTVKEFLNKDPWEHLKGALKWNI